MTTRTKQLRAVVLAALMVLSVIAMGTAFVGTAAAANSAGDGVKISVGDVTLAETTSTGTFTVRENEINDYTFIVNETIDGNNYDENADEFAYKIEFTDDLELQGSSEVTGVQILEGTDISIASSSVVSDTAFVNFSVGTVEGEAASTDDTLDVQFTITDVVTKDSASTSDSTPDITASVVNDGDSSPGDNVIFADGGDGENGLEYLDGFDVQTISDNEASPSARSTYNRGDRVYLGEQGIDTTGNLTAPGSQLFKDAGDAQGTPLGDDIELDQPLGSYTGSTAADTVTLVEPRISTFEIRQNGNDVTGGTMLQGQSAIEEVFVSYNFADAEDITISVEDATGLDVTSEFVLSDPTQDNGTSVPTDVAFAVDPDGVDVGTYTVTVEGSNDIDDGEAIQSETITISDDQSASLSLAESSVVQGNTVDFTVTGVQEGSNVTVGIEQGDRIDDTVTENQLFRKVGDTNAQDTTFDSGGGPADIDGTEYYLAQLEIDGGQAVGSVDTSFLDTGDVTLTVWPDAISGSTPAADTDDDSVDLTVEEGSVSLDSPSGVYTIGSTVDISGTASEGIDAVALYARGSGDWERVDFNSGNNEISVDPDGTFEQSDVNLVADSAGGNNLLAVAGSYRLAIVDAEGADTDDSSGADDTLNSSAFADATTDTGSIVTSDGSLAATFTTYNGQIAVGDDDLDVEGTATSNAGDGILLVLVDTRGNIESKEITVEDDGSFDSDITSFGNMTEGSVSAHVIAPGADGTYGNTGDDAANFNDGESGDLYNFTGTGAQVESQILANTVDDTASDDQIVTQTFRYANARTSIDTVSSPVEADGTLTVEGQTNRDPDQADIIVELFDADDTSQALISVEEWDSDGAWSAELDLTDLPTGSYTVEADDTSSSDRADVEIVDEVTPPTPEPEPEPEPTPEPTEEPTEEPAEEETPAETPGFGLLVALTALVAAGFLALRRLE